MDGAATEKARRASSVCTRGTTSIGASEERRARGGARVCASSLRYVGVAVIIAGNMNCGHIDWTTTTISSVANERAAHNELLNLLDEHSLTNTQYQSTREDKNLDLHLTTRPSLIRSQSLIPGISDHDIIVVDSDIKPTYSAKLPRKVYSFNSAKADWATIKAKTTQYTEGYLRSHHSNSVDQKWTSIRKHLLDMLDKHIPSKYKSSRHVTFMSEVKSEYRNL